jgi:hypothetical protein
MRPFTTAPPGVSTIALADPANGNYGASPIGSHSHHGLSGFRNNVVNGAASPSITT